GGELLVDAAFGEVRARVRSLASLCEHLRVQTRRSLGGGVQRLTPSGRAPLLRGVALVVQLHARVLRQPLHGLGKAQVFDLAQEPDRVATGAASEAVVDLLRGRHAEARGLLLVERAEPRHGVVAGLLEREVLRDELDDVGPLPDLLDVFLPDLPRHLRSYSRSQPWGRKSRSYVRTAYRSVMPLM